MEMVLRRMRTALIAVLALTAAALAAAVPVARAGQYHVYGCRTPSGQPAPADGWSGSVAPGGAFDQYAKNTCAQGGALIAALGDATSHGAYIDKATWAFAAPAGESIAAATLFRAGDNAGGGNAAFTYETWLSGTNESSIFDQCIFTLNCPGRGNTAQPLSSENRIVVPAANLGSHLYASASCAGFAGAECAAGSGDASGYAAAVYVYASDVTLEQGTGPSAGGVGGELASAPSVRGTSDLTFTASDPGSGVYAAVVSVDGQVVERPVLNDNGGRCRDVGAGDGRPAFLAVQPCPGTVSADVALDTTRLTDGAHHLVVSVLDAAGNSAPVIDREITVANPPQACAAGAAASASASAQAALGASWKGARGARTAPNGRFAVRLPRGTSSRMICLAYRPPGGAPPVTRALVLRVRAGIALRVSPRTTSVGQQIVFHGRLLAGPIPSEGKQLVLEARSPGGPWIEFNLIRTGPRGRFRATYRFRFPGPANYQFRARSEPESDYPFAAGSSNLVGVHER